MKNNTCPKCNYDKQWKVQRGKLKDVVPSNRGYLQGPLGMLLPLYIIPVVLGVFTPMPGKREGL
jgi:hypothetical protein